MGKKQPRCCFSPSPSRWATSCSVCRHMRVWAVGHLSRDHTGSLRMAEAEKGETQNVHPRDGQCLVVGKMDHTVNRTRLVNRAPAGINLAHWGCSPGAAGHSVRALSRGEREKEAE